MNKRTAYRYAVLRYVHEAASGEFLNVGIVLRTQNSRDVYVRFNSSLLRLQLAFPDCNTKVLRETLSHLEQSIEANAGRDEESFEKLLQFWLPESARGLQWSEPAAGVSTNPARAVDDLFVSLVAKKGSAYERFEAALYSRLNIFAHFASTPAQRVLSDPASNEPQWQQDVAPKRIAMRS